MWSCAQPGSHSAWKSFPCTWRTLSEEAPAELAVLPSTAANGQRSRRERHCWWPEHPRSEPRGEASPISSRSPAGGPDQPFHLVIISRLGLAAPVRQEKSLLGGHAAEVIREQSVFHALIADHGFG